MPGEQTIVSKHPFNPLRSVGGRGRNDARARMIEALIRIRDEPFKVSDLPDVMNRSSKYKFVNESVDADAIEPCGKAEYMVTESGWRAIGVALYTVWDALIKLEDTDEETAKVRVEHRWRESDWIDFDKVMTESDTRYEQDLKKAERLLQDL